MRNARAMRWPVWRRNTERAELLAPARHELSILGLGRSVPARPTRGVPGVGIHHDTARDWDVHHSKADTFDKINKDDLARNAAIVAIATYLLADMPDSLRP